MNFYFVIARTTGHLALLLYLAAHIVSSHSSAQTLEEMRRAATDARIASQKVDHLEADIGALNLQQRLTAVETTLKSAESNIEKAVQWQDKFQWALLALLGEAGLRVYGQLKAGKTNRTSSTESAD